MTNPAIIIKVKERLNKLDSQDFQNIATWKILEAFNKGQLEWCRRNLHGLNATREGDEQSTSRIDDLQVLIATTNPLSFVDKGAYFESSNWPDNYFRYKRLALEATNVCCDQAKRIRCDLVEQGNVDILLSDPNTRPSYDWGETFFTISNNRVQLYHNGEFAVKEARFIYYRRPVNIKMIGQVDMETGVASTVEVQCEFKEDLAELLVSEAVSILAGDIESAQRQRAEQDVEKNN